jgi:hypothetical protein
MRRGGGYGPGCDTCGKRDLRGVDDDLDLERSLCVRKHADSSSGDDGRFAGERQSTCCFQMARWFRSAGERSGCGVKGGGVRWRIVGF